MFHLLHPYLVYHPNLHHCLFTTYFSIKNIKLQGLTGTPWELIRLIENIPNNIIINEADQKWCRYVPM